jgi:hypothetical protein
MADPERSALVQCASEPFPDSGVVVSIHQVSLLQDNHDTGNPESKEKYTCPDVKSVMKLIKRTYTTFIKTKYLRTLHLLLSR